MLYLHKILPVFFPPTVDFRTGPARASSLLDLAPTADSLARTELALREAYGYWYYRLVG